MLHLYLPAKGGLGSKEYKNNALTNTERNSVTSRQGALVIVHDRFVQRNRSLPWDSADFQHNYMVSGFDFWWKLNNQNIYASKTKCTLLTPQLPNNFFFAGSNSLPNILHSFELGNDIEAFRPNGSISARWAASSTSLALLQIHLGLCGVMMTHHQSAGPQQPALLASEEIIINKLMSDTIN